MALSALIGGEVNAADGSFAVAHLTGRPLAVFEIYHLENLFQRID